MKTVEFTPYAMLLFIHLQFQHDIIHDLHYLGRLGKERTDSVAGIMGPSTLEGSLIPGGGGNDISENKYNLKGGATPKMPENFDTILQKFFLMVLQEVLDAKGCSPA